MKDYAIVFITTDGIQHLCGGVGHYTSKFIEVLAELEEKIKKYNISITIYACEPALLSILPTYNQNHYELVERTIKKTGGKFFKLVNNTHGEDWIGHEENWKILSSSAATIALNISKFYDHTIVFFGCSCLAMTQVYIHKQSKAFQTSISTVYLTHDSAFSAFYQEKNENILSMDFLCAHWANINKNAKIGYVSEYMKALYKKNYFVKEENFIECKGGVFIEDKRFQNVPEEVVEKLMDQYSIPKNKLLVFSWGRAENYKRFDLVFQSCNQLDNIYPVVVTNGEHKSLRSYIERNNLIGTLIENYKDFTLINGIVSWKNTICCCFFSDNEPGAITPMEAMYMAKRGKSVVLVKEEGHFDSMVEDNVNGFKCKNNVDDIVKKLEFILGLSEERIIQINRSAYKNVINRHNQYNKYIDTICACIPELKKYKNELVKQYSNLY